MYQAWNDSGGTGRGDEYHQKHVFYYENDHGDMKQSMIAEFADILNTTVEYLVCGIVNESASDETSAEMLRLFSSMDEQTKEIMLIQMRALVVAKRK